MTNPSGQHMRNNIYDHPSSVKARAKPVADPVAQLRGKHVRERAALGLLHRRALLELEVAHTRARARLGGARDPVAEHVAKAERSALMARQAKEADKLGADQARELDELAAKHMAP